MFANNIALKRKLNVKGVMKTNGCWDIIIQEIKSRNGLSQEIVML